MSLINPVFLYGLFLVGVPVLLHFLLKARPKKIVFPALRLIQQRRKRNMRQMRLRHVLLMLLRMAVLGALVFALARPSLPAADYTPNWRELLTMGAVCLAGWGAYAWIVSRWRRRGMSPVEMSTRRSSLRGITSVSVLVLLLLLVGWPYGRRIAAEMTAPATQAADVLPVSAVFLFDTSVSMDYRLESRTRLEAAQQIGREHLKNLPAQSRVAVAESGGNSPILFQADLAAAIERIDSLTSHARSETLDDRLQAAIETQRTDRERTLQSQGDIPDDDRSDRFIREVYLFTDLAASAWDLESRSRLKEQLAAVPWLGVYLIDVSADNVTNVSLQNLSLSAETVPAGTTAYVEVEVAAVGAGERDQTVELYVQGPAGGSAKQGQKSLQLSGTSSGRLAFAVTSTTDPFLQGELRLLSSDPLEADDVQYFTVRSESPPPILVTAPRESDAAYFLEALNPGTATQQNQRRFDVRFVPADSLAETDFTGQAVVCLLNATEILPPVWERLNRYVTTGGGLAVILGSPGRDAVETMLNYNVEEAQRLLPAELLAALKFTPPQYLNPDRLEHPIWRTLRELGGAAELGSVDVRRYWKVASNERVEIVARYTDRDALPALLTRSVGSGRVAMLTTGADLRGWSDLPRTWQFLPFVEGLVHYLRGAGFERWNYSAGETVMISDVGSARVKEALLRMPSLQQLPVERRSAEGPWIINAADVTGQYGLVSTDESQPWQAGFSVNLPKGESDLTRLTTDQLDNLLGKSRYGLARDTEALVRSVQTGRLGVEVSPLILMILVIVFCGEHLVANRFYEVELPEAGVPNGAGRGNSAGSPKTNSASGINVNTSSSNQRDTVVTAQP